jgi:hypothetical protein
VIRGREKEGGVLQGITFAMLEEDSGKVADLYKYGN